MKESDLVKLGYSLDDFEYQRLNDWTVLILSCKDPECQGTMCKLCNSKIRLETPRVTPIDPVIFPPAQIDPGANSGNENNNQSGNPTNPVDPEEYERMVLNSDAIREIVEANREHHLTRRQVIASLEDEVKDLRQTVEDLHQENLQKEVELRDEQNVVLRSVLEDSLESFLTEKIVGSELINKVYEQLNALTDLMVDGQAVVEKVESVSNSLDDVTQKLDNYDERFEQIEEKIEEATSQLQVEVEVDALKPATFESFVGDFNAKHTVISTTLVDLINLAIEADDSPDIERVRGELVNQILAINEALGSVSSDVAAFKEHLTTAGSLEELLEQLKEAIANANNGNEPEGGEGSGDGNGSNEGDGNEQIQVVENFASFVVFPTVEAGGDWEIESNDGVISIQPARNPSWYYGFRSTTDAVYKPGEYLQWTYDGTAAIIGLSLFPTSSESWRNPFAAWYFKSNYAQAFGNGQYISNEKFTWESGRKARIALNRSGFIEWQLETADGVLQIVKEINYSKPTGRLFPYGVFGSKSSKLSEIVIANVN